jgi:hypothetical protein
VIDARPTLLVIKTGIRTLAEEDLALFFTAKAVQGTLGLQRAAVARGSRRSTMPPRIGDLRRSLDRTRLGGCSSGPPVCVPPTPPSQRAELISHTNGRLEQPSWPSVFDSARIKAGGTSSNRIHLTAHRAAHSLPTPQHTLTLSNYPIIIMQFRATFALAIAVSCMSLVQAAPVGNILCGGIYSKCSVSAASS